MKIKKICTKCTILMSAITLLALCILPIGAVYTDEFSYFIGDTNTNGEFSSVRFWERANKAQAYILPNYQPYYDHNNDGGVAERYSYAPIYIPTYVTDPFTLPDIDEDDYGSINAIGALYTHEVNGTLTATTNGGVQIMALTRNGKYSEGTMTYRLSQNLTDTFQPNTRELWIGEIYSAYGTHEFGTIVNEVEVNGLTIENVSNGTVIVYLCGQMYWAGPANSEYPETGVVPVDTYVLLKPGNKVSINRTFIEGETNGITPIITRWDGSIMVRYGTDCDRAVQYTETFNDYYSKCYSYNDSNLVGLQAGSDGRSGGFSIANSWAMQQYMGQTLENGTIIVPSGTLTITQNGYYDVKKYATVAVGVDTYDGEGLPDMWTWLFDSMGAILGFEIAPGWTIGILMTIIVGLAVAIWAIRVFMG